IATDSFGQKLLAVDPVTGQRRVLSNFADAGKGPTGKPYDVTVSSTGGFFVTDGNDGGLVFSVTPGTGDRAILSDFSNPAQGAIGYHAWGIILDVDGFPLVTDGGPGGGPGAGLWKINTSNGFRTLISDFSKPPVYPPGPQGVALDASGAIYVMDRSAGTICRPLLDSNTCGALFRVDRVTGAKTLVSDFGNPAQGPLGSVPNDIVLDTNGTFLVGDEYAGTCSGGCPVIFRVDIATGQRTVVSDSAHATQGPTMGGSLAIGGTKLLTNCSAPIGADIRNVYRVQRTRTVIIEFCNAAKVPVG